MKLFFSFKHFSFFFTKLLTPGFRVHLCGSEAWDQPVKALLNLCSLRCLFLQDQHLCLKGPLTVRRPGLGENLLLLSNDGCSQLCQVQADWIFRSNKIRLYLIHLEQFQIQTSKGSVFTSVSTFTIGFGIACLYCPICFSTGCYFLVNA